MQQSYEIITVDNIRYLRIPELYERGLNHIFTSLDMNMKVTDSKDDRQVEKNLQKIYQVMDIAPEQYYFMEQQHTDWVSIVDEVELGRRYNFGHRAVGVDGLITSQHNFVLSSSEADCVPVLLYDPVKKVQANLHSGWKGTLAKISQMAIKNFQLAYQVDPANLIVGIGPHIRRESYEVQYDVADLFYGAFYNYDEIIFQDDAGRITLDLEKAVVTSLVDAGVLEENIYTVGLNTFTEDKLLHSYRRDKDKAGSMATLSTLMQAGEYFVPEEEEA